MVLERTVQKLRGVSYLDLEEVVPDKQQIMSSRLFGAIDYDRAEQEEAVPVTLPGQPKSYELRMR